MHRTIPSTTRYASTGHRIGRQHYSTVISTGNRVHGEIKCKAAHFWYKLSCVAGFLCLISQRLHLNCQPEGSAYPGTIRYVSTGHRLGGS
eukprot:3566397-Rhodomonas_salina.1